MQKSENVGGWIFFFLVEHRVWGFWSENWWDFIGKLENIGKAEKSSTHYSQWNYLVLYLYTTVKFRAWVKYKKFQFFQLENCVFLRKIFIFWRKTFSFQGIFCFEGKSSVLQVIPNFSRKIWVFPRKFFFFKENFHFPNENFYFSRKMFKFQGNSLIFKENCLFSRQIFHFGEENFHLQSENLPFPLKISILERKMFILQRKF